MQDERNKIDAEKTEQGSVAVVLRQVPMLLLMVAVMSIAVLGLVTAAIASGSQPDAADASRLSPPMILPGDASASSSHSYNADSDRWIIGAEPGTRSRRIARDSGATTVNAASGIYAIAREDAASFAEALRRTRDLAYAEPDVAITFSSYPADLRASEQWWLDQVVNTNEITPPPVTPNSPRLGLVEESLNPLHPDLLKANLKGAFSLDPSSDSHGTAVAAIAGSPGEGAGIRGVWPGMNMTHFPSGNNCVAATKAVFTAARAKVAAINMSYGFPSDVCFSHYVATEAAVRKGVLPVASAGNTASPAELGNVAMRPATDPHVISVSAVDQDGLVADFATRNEQVDITAPGKGIYSPFIANGSAGSDETLDLSWALNSGTSFSSPMVAAAATMLSQARPELGARQIGRLLTSSATDLGEPGRDQLYGEGLLNIDSALSFKSPPADPKEPNNDIDWVNGSLLSGKAGFVWKPGRKRTGSITATLARTKDPADVYRVRVAPRGKVLITAAQYQGDVKLKVFGPKAKTISKAKRQVIVRSDKPRPKTEGVIVTNRKRRTQLVYVALKTSPRWSGEYSRYRLEVARR